MRRRWNPRLHPRDRRGRFAETAGGTSWAARMATQVDRQVVRRVGARTTAPERPATGDLVGRDMPAPIGTTIRDSLRTARSHYHLERAFRDELAKLRRPGDSQITLNFLGSLDTTREHMEGVLRCLERFPRIQLNSITYFYPDKEDATHYAHVYGGKYAIAARKRGDPIEYRRFANMEFNASWLANASRQRYVESLARDRQAKPGLTAWAQGGASNGIDVAVHEFGHVLDFGTDEEIGTQAPELLAAIAERYEQRTGVTLARSDVAKSISTYAMTVREHGAGYQELIAEAFTDVMFHGNEASPISREIYRRLVAAYERKYNA